MGVPDMPSHLFLVIEQFWNEFSQSSFLSFIDNMIKLIMRQIGLSEGQRSSNHEVQIRGRKGSNARRNFTRGASHLSKSSILTVTPLCVTKLCSILPVTDNTINEKNRPKPKHDHSSILT